MAPASTPPEPQQTRGAPINVDDQVLPAVKNGGPPQDYDDSVFPGGSSSEIKPRTGEAAEEIGTKFMKTAEPLIPLFGEEVVRKMFSKKWPFRAEALDTMLQMTLEDPEQRMAYYLSAINEGVKDKIQAVSLKALTNLENLLNQVQGVSNSQVLSANIDFLGMQIMDKIGNNSKGIKDKTTDIARMLFSHPLAGPQFLVKHLSLIHI